MATSPPKRKIGKLKCGGMAAPIDVAWAAPRCQAKSKRTMKRCGAPAMRGKRVCYHHGGKSTGPKTTEGRRRCAEANITHGYYTKEARRERRIAKRQEQETIRLLKELYGKRYRIRRRAWDESKVRRNDKGQFTQS